MRENEAQKCPTLVAERIATSITIFPRPWQRRLLGLYTIYALVGIACVVAVMFWFLWTHLVFYKGEILGCDGPAEVILHYTRHGLQSAPDNVLEGPVARVHLFRGNFPQFFINFTGNDALTLCYNRMDQRDASAKVRYASKGSCPGQEWCTDQIYVCWDGECRPSGVTEQLRTIFHDVCALLAFAFAFTFLIGLSTKLIRRRRIVTAMMERVVVPD
jgi:hypothetical protein